MRIQDKPLTKAQQAVYDVIKTHNLHENKPSMRQLAFELNYKGTSGVQRQVDYLRRRGLIRESDGKHGLEVVADTTGSMGAA